MVDTDTWVLLKLQPVNQGKNAWRKIAGVSHKDMIHLEQQVSPSILFGQRRELHRTHGGGVEDLTLFRKPDFAVTLLNERRAKE